MPKSIVLSTENVNAYGTWLLTKGAKLDLFRANPVMFYDHDDKKLPIGIWENIREENGMILADPKFDADPDSQLIKSKYDSGSIRGASMGLDIINTSTDLKLKKPGQTVATVTEWEPYEASLTPKPGNKDCLKLHFRRNGIELSEKGSNNNLLPFLKEENQEETNSENNMKSIALNVGLPEDATEAQINAKINELKLNAKHAETLQLHFNKAAEKLGDKAKGIYLTLSKTSPEQALEFLELNKPSEEKPKDGKNEKVSDLIKPGKTVELSDTEKEKADEKETFDYLQKNDPEALKQIRLSDPAKYEKLATDYQKGVRCKS